MVGLLAQTHSWIVVKQRFKEDNELSSKNEDT